jgi:hypothetical protein
VEEVIGAVLHDLVLLILDQGQDMRVLVLGQLHGDKSQEWVWDVDCSLWYILALHALYPTLEVRPNGT